MTTSFPFLKIARDHGRSYGHVIRMVQDVELRLHLGGSYQRAIEWNATLSGPSPELLRAVLDAIETERVRRLPPKDQGGGT